MKFEEEYGKLEADKCFQKESWTKYMRQTLVLMWINAIQETFDFFSASNEKRFDWRGKLDTNL